MKRLAKLYRAALEAANKKEARELRRELRREIRRRREHRELLPSQRGGVGFDGFAYVDPNYHWEDWN